MANKRVSGYAIASLILGIVSMCIGWVFILGWALIVLALVFGFIALKQTKNDKNITGKGMAIAGIVLGFVGLAIAILVLLATISVFMLAASVNVTENPDSNLNSTISPTGITGTWAGSATLTNNCANPACEYIGSMNPPSVALALEQSGNTVTGAIAIEITNAKTLIAGQDCQAMEGSGMISEGKISGTRLTFYDPGNNFWSLNVIGNSMQGTVTSNVPGCTGLQTKVGASNPVSLTKQ